MPNLFDKIEKYAEICAEEEDTDFVVYLGDMVKPRDEYLIDQCLQRRRRKNILLMLVTRGGDASVAYRIGRAFQKFYNIEERTAEGEGPEFSIFIPTLCKSAGTILATAATRLIMSDFAELGPIEVQLRNPLEVGERISSLAPVQALESLQRHSMTSFKQYFEQLRFDPTLVLSTKMASEVATGLTVGLFNSIYGQVDPIRLAEVERSLKLSGEYTQRLTPSRAHSNLNDDTADKLLGDYPSHGFVIDAKEAKGLFKRVDDPNEHLKKMLTADCRFFFHWALDSMEEPYVQFVSREPKEKEDEEILDGKSADSEGKANSKIHQDANTEKDVSETGDPGPSPKAPEQT